jgi:hypothetical protein
MSVAETDTASALLAGAAAARSILRRERGADAELMRSLVVWPTHALEKSAPAAQPRSPLPREVVERLFELRDQGLPYSTIAKLLARPVSTLKAVGRLGRGEALRRYGGAA